jgi:hypothetical protein
MLTFLRKIRKSLVDSGSLQKYLLYAIGEVLLVVIGILIALSINNQSTLQKNEEKVQLLLQEIQNDLAADIEQVNVALEYWQKKDSLLDIVLEKQLEAKDYWVGAGFLSLLTQYEIVEFSDNGYKNLVQNVDIIPPGYSDLLQDLNKLYLKDKVKVQTFNEALKDFVNKILNKWSEEHEWFSDYYNSSSVGDAVQYFLTDPFYKNDCARLKIIVEYNYLPFLKKYKHYAAKMYLQISNALGQEDVLPEVLSDYTSYIPFSTLNKYAGQYQMFGSKYRTQVTVEDIFLLFGFAGKTYEFLPKTDSTFYNFEKEYVLLFKKQASNNVDGLELIFPNGMKSRFIKVEEEVFSE